MEKDIDPNLVGYPSDLTDAEWEIISLILEEIEPYRIGRPRTVDLRKVVNAIYYLNKTGCPWRYYPGKTPGFAGGPKKFDNYGSPSRKLRVVSRQAHTCGESRWTNLRA